jgi:predicted RNase H-like HicB family nuclease
MKTAADIEMIIEKTNTGYSAFAKDYPVATVGDTAEELFNYMLEAMNLYFEEAKSPRKVTLQDLKMTLDLHQFFEYYKIINTKALGERIGVNQTLLSQYINGHKKPSVKQEQRILQGLRDLGRELMQVEFVEVYKGGKRGISKKGN